MDTAVQTCYRHPDRRAGVICQRCDRPICPDCMRQASVGFHCPECTKTTGQKIVHGAHLPAPALVTRVIIAINLAVFAAGIGSGLRTRPEFTGYGGLVGEGRILDGIAIRPDAVAFGELVGVAHGEWWRLVSSGFLHANVIHIGFNMFVLYQLGQLLEPMMGRLRFGLAYGVTMLCGGFGVLLLDPGRFTVGASGAVYGLLGVTLAVFRARGINPFDTGLGAIVVLNLILTFSIPGISIGGHVGGLIGGVIVGWLIFEGGPRYLRNPNVTMGVIAALGLTVTAGGILVA